jgi:5,10-methylene-tetrahydrofolate dehydrogenase/methenyl tetrahydrofolate cyclohydrolase
MKKKKKKKKKKQQEVSIKDTAPTVVNRNEVVGEEIYMLLTPDLATCSCAAHTPPLGSTKFFSG